MHWMIICLHLLFLRSIFTYTDNKLVTLHFTGPWLHYTTR